MTDMHPLRQLAEEENLADDLAAVLIALYGEYHYMAATRHALSLSDKNGDRTIRNWLTKRSPIPMTVIEELDCKVDDALAALLAAKTILARMKDAK